MKKRTPSLLRTLVNAQRFTPCVCLCTEMATAGIPGYVVTGKLGSGSDSEVYECVDKKTGTKVAVKVIRKDQAPERLERSRKEAEVLELLDHPHVVKIHEWFETDDALYIVLECAGGGDLFEVLYSHELNPSQTVLEERCARRIFTQTALAVSHMHRKGVCHRDLKPEVRASSFAGPLLLYSLPLE
jgi:serine/threonine protein kinase